MLAQNKERRSAELAACLINANRKRIAKKHISGLATHQELSVPEEATFFNQHASDYPLSCCGEPLHAENTLRTASSGCFCDPCWHALDID